MTFKVFAKQIKTRFKAMQNSTLYRVAITADELYNLYLNSFPRGTNEIYKTRTEHDCQCCKNFIRDVGNAVAIVDGEVKTIWGATGIPFPYNIVAGALDLYVKSRPIEGVFSHKYSSVGKETTRQLLEETSVSIKTWDHFHADISAKHLSSHSHNTPDRLNEAKQSVQVFERGLQTVTFEAVRTVLDLIAEGNLYRGEEHREKVAMFHALQIELFAIGGQDRESTPIERNIFYWTHYKTPGARIRNEVIGTLLIDISEGTPIEQAVNAFESKVAPMNYKRPNALITKAMVDQAMATISTLGIEDSLKRRFAVAEDLSINDVLFVNSDTAPALKAGGDLTSMLMKQVKPTHPITYEAEEVTIGEFTAHILPNINKLEVMFEARHISNLVSLIAPEVPNSPNILKWDNNFSWTYNGNVTDSIKERVAKAGGSVTGALRVSLSWHNYDDLDLHCYESNGNHIYFGEKRSLYSDGYLDVDMNISPNGSREAVENITWGKVPPDGKYKILVNNYSKRESFDTGFTVQLEYKGEIKNYSMPISPREKQTVTVISLHIEDGRLTMIESEPDVRSACVDRTIWGLTTSQIYKVKLLTISPNHWDNNKIKTGNKHYFFMLDYCTNNSVQVRGIYNEFLSNDLDKHRKVFEVIGNRIEVKPMEKSIVDYSALDGSCSTRSYELSGLGFSTTVRNSLLVKASGRPYKINF